MSRPLKHDRNPEIKNAIAPELGIEIPSPSAVPRLESSIMTRFPFIFSVALLALALPPVLAAADEGFKWTDTPGKHTDLQFEGRNVFRYDYERIDESSPERREQTYKVFHHVYDVEGKSFITKGPGGKYTHHRGIFFGFNKVSYTDAAGKTHNVDIWHCKNAYQTHEKVLSQTGGKDRAVQRLAIDWHGEGGEVFLKEERQLTIAMVDGGLQVDFESTLTPAVPQVTLDGDPQHAGFQFRASNEVAEATAGQTCYIRPGTGKGEPGQTINWKKGSPKSDPALVDLPWKGMSFVVEGRRYTAVYLDRPGNPKPAVHSERDYGRFGSYFVAALTPDKPLTVRYRLVIVKGELSPDEISNLSAQFK